MFMCISLKCWDRQFYKDALRRIKIQFDRGTRHCVKERLARTSRTPNVGGWYPLESTSQQKKIRHDFKCRVGGNPL